ncbi:MAG: PAS domain S-box protein, partial [Candidatus Heimdallarchaeota archaeon]
GAVQLTSQKPKQFSEDDKIFIESLILMLRSILDRYNVELALAKISQERKALNTIINLSPAIVFLWENKIDWPVEYVSENIEIFGYSPEDFYSGDIPYSSIIHPDDLERVSQEVEKYSEDPKCQNFTQEYRIITKSGNTRWTLDFTSIKRDNQGNITHFHGIVLDITERKKAQVSLNREREAFQIIANATAISSSVLELCISIVNDLADVLDFDFGAISLYDEESKMMTPIKNEKVEILLNHNFIPISIDDPEYLYAHVARTKKAIFAPDIALLDLDKKAFDKVNRFNIKAVVTWPMVKTNGELLGILQFGSFNVKEMPEEDKIVFKTIASSVSNVIERLLIDNARIESEQKFRAFAEQSLAGVFLFNSAGKILFANKRIEEITEYSINEIQETQIAEFLSKIHPNQSSAIQESLNFAELSSIQGAIVNEYEIKTKNGFNKWAQINLAPIKLENDFLFAVMMIDTTKERHIQSALERERKLLTVISEATANNVNVKNMCQQVLEGIIKVFDLQSGTARCYDETTGLLEIYSEYGIADSEKYLLEPVNFKESSYPVAKFARDNVKLFSLDAPNDPIIKKFDLITLHDFTVYIFYPILNAKKEFLGTLQIGSKKETNLTEYDVKSFDSIVEIFASAIEHLRVIEELDINQQKFKRTVDTILDGITIIENNKIIYANDRMAQIYGISKEEFYQSSPFDSVDPVSIMEFKEKMKEILTNQISKSNFEYWIIRKNGERRYIRNSLFVEFLDKKAKAIFMACSDITERKIAQDGLKQLNEELEHRVTERTEQLERLNKELEAFSYSISHDLRSPLRSINGFSQALLEDFEEDLDETGKDYLQRIRNASIKMSTLIDDILALSRISNAAISFREINLSKIADSIILNLRNQNPDRKVSVKIEKNITAHCDSTMMRTVLENLLENAWKFTSKTSNAKIKFGAKKIDEELIYYIQDNGVGFDMAYLDKLFVLFQRLHQYEEYTGTGVGLAIVQRIINRQNGEVWAEGKIDKGATFFFKFNPTSQQ